MVTHLTVLVTPHAKHSQIVGWHEEGLKVKIRGIPEKGQVNRALIEFLADVLDIPKSHIILTHGMTSRKKTVHISSMTQEQVYEKLTKEIGNQ